MRENGCRKMAYGMTKKQSTRRKKRKEDSRKWMKEEGTRKDEGGKNE